jgi:enolase-phosphatase E1
MKVNKESYERILKEIGKKSNEVVFLTDLLNEAEAATSAGIKVYVLRRPDNPDTSVGEFDFIETFNQFF